MAKRTEISSQAVFLNVPYDRSYEPKLIAFIAGLVALGRQPRCVLEIPETGQGRLNRIVDHLESCRVSIHDLSHVGQPTRFNMPFELGLACALRRYQYRSGYKYLVFETKRDRLTRTLSDLRGQDPWIHGGRVRGVISCLLDALGTGVHDPTPQTVFSLYLKLRKVASELKRSHHRKDIFSASIFRELTATALGLAMDANLIRK